MKTKRIEYEDDFVVVYDKDGSVVYRGMEDYEPYKDEPWRFDEKQGVYTLNGMTKKCYEL